MAGSFFEDPILNSPYEEPTHHHALDGEGQPTDLPPITGRRPSALLSPVPKARKRRGKKVEPEDQQSLGLSLGDGVSNAEQDYNPTPIINKIRSHMALWRALRNPNDWGVTPATARLLNHWRHHPFAGLRPFFCQVEAIETIIWLTEVAGKNKRIKDYKEIWDHIENGNAQANPDLLRLAMKMATGAGKTTVMAMLIAWQTINAVRSPTSKQFSRAFLIIAPGITIKDRLRVLLPEDGESYYKSRELVPDDMLGDLGKAKIVITNYHAFQRREKLDINKTTKSLLQGRHAPIETKETEGQMVQRVADSLMGLKNIVVINDEAHHCYREKEEGEEGPLTGEAKKEAADNQAKARLWISGIEAFKRKLGIRAVYDLSATPFFLSGSGWAEGTLFPWTVSDFSLMDAIECGIVKLPRIPVDDNIPGAEMPVLRNLWEHIGKDMPKKSGFVGNPNELPDKLITALNSLYGHYEQVNAAWERKGIETPPVFIIVCNNTSTSRLVYEWISGWERADEDGEMAFLHRGNLSLFQNYNEHGDRKARPQTLLIDSKQIESGELDKTFHKAAATEIELFRRERLQRGETGAISDADLLREVMNTVGKKGKLGEQVRCVVSVSMLTEGWDTNNVTHIVGVRAFGTQLLCEQVVGRALRRQNYEVNDKGHFEAEYADILGIPFNFTAKPVVAPPKAPRKVTSVKAVKERAPLEIRFPRVSGYRVVMSEKSIAADFTEESRYVIDHDMIGASQTDMSGIVGQGHTLSLEEAQSMRPSEILLHLSKAMLERYYTDKDGRQKIPMFGQIKRICRQWLEGGYLVCPGDTNPWMITHYQEIKAQACERIYNAIMRHARITAESQGKTPQIQVMLDPYNPSGSTRFVSFSTTKDVRETSANHCHVNFVTLDSDWEAELSRIVENHPRTVSYVKNQGLGLSVPYKDGGISRDYIPDFIVCIDDGRGVDDLLHLIIEVKGFKRENVKLKQDIMTEKWIPGVNAHGQFGRWAFAQFESVFDMDKDFAKLVDHHLQKGQV